MADSTKRPEGHPAEPKGPEEDSSKQIPYAGPQRAAPYPLSRLAPSFNLVDAAKEVQSADAAIRNHTEGKLRVIVEQIRALQTQASSILENASRAAEIHRAECKFKKIPGRTYHLYERESGRRYLSMLSPHDWDDQAPHAFIGSFRLEADMSWTNVAQLGDDREDDAVLIRKLLDGAD